MTLAHATDETVDQKLLWRAKNRRALGEIAEQFDVTYGFVRRVFLGEMPSGELRVERELRRRGCPGFDSEG
jgi:hypothetical protein